MVIILELDVVNHGPWAGLGASESFILASSNWTLPHSQELCSHLSSKTILLIPGASELPLFRLNLTPKTSEGVFIRPILLRTLVAKGQLLGVWDVDGTQICEDWKEDGNPRRERRVLFMLLVQISNLGGSLDKNCSGMATWYSLCKIPGTVSGTY